MGNDVLSCLCVPEMGSKNLPASCAVGAGWMLVLGFTVHLQSMALPVSAFTRSKEGHKSGHKIEFDRNLRNMPFCSMYLHVLEYKEMVPFHASI